MVEFWVGRRGIEKKIRIRSGLHKLPIIRRIEKGFYKEKEKRDLLLDMFALRVFQKRRLRAEGI